MRNVFQKILAAITTPAQLPVGENQEAAMPTLETIDSDTKTNSNTENEMFAKIKAMFKKEAVMEINVENPVEDEMDFEIEVAEAVIEAEVCPPAAKVATYVAAPEFDDLANEISSRIDSRIVYVDLSADVIPTACEMMANEGVAEGCNYQVTDIAAKRHLTRSLNREIANKNWQVHLARLAAFRARSPKAGTCNGGNALHRRRKAHSAVKAAVKAAAKIRRADRIKAAAFEAARVRLERFFGTLAQAFLGTLKPAFRQIFRVNRSIRRQHRAAEKRAVRLAAVQAAHAKWVAENPAALATQTPEAKAARLAVEAEKATLIAEREARKQAWLDRQTKKIEDKAVTAPRLSAEEARAAKSARKAAEKKATKPVAKPVVKSKEGTVSVSFVAPTAKPSGKKALVTVTKSAKKAPVAKLGRPERVIPGNNLPKGLRKKAAEIFAPDPVPANPVRVTAAAPVAAPVAPAPVVATLKLSEEEILELLPEGTTSIEEILYPYDNNADTMSDLLAACLIYGVKSGLEFYHHSGCAELELNDDELNDDELNDTENNGGNQ
jgi:hypothetical protein